MDCESILQENNQMLKVLLNQQGENTADIVKIKSDVEMLRGGFVQINEKIEKQIQYFEAINTMLGIPNK